MIWHNKNRLGRLSDDSQCRPTNCTYQLSVLRHTHPQSRPPTCPLVSTSSKIDYHNGDVNGMPVKTAELPLKPIIMT